MPYLWTSQRHITDDNLKTEIELYFYPAGLKSSLHDTVIIGTLLSSCDIFFHLSELPCVFGTELIAYIIKNQPLELCDDFT